MQGSVTYKPRSLFVDLSGGLGGTSLSVSNTLDAVGNSSVSTWSGSVQVCRAERVPKSGFLQRLEEQAALEGTEDGEYVGIVCIYFSLPCYHIC